MGRFCFTPDDRCIGGAHQIDAEYLNMQKKIYEASTKAKCWQTTSHNSQQSASTLAQQLSRNRSPSPSACSLKCGSIRRRRQTIADTTMWNHYNNLFHLQRRIAEQSSYTERKKNHCDSEIYPVRIHRRPSSHSSAGLISRPTSARLSTKEMRRESREGKEVFALFRDSLLRTIAAEEEPTEMRVKQIFDSYILDTPFEHQEVLLDVIQYVSTELGI